MRPRKLSEATRAELERVVGLKMQIPPYKEIAARDGTSARYIRQLISAMLKSRKANLCDVSCGTNEPDNTAGPSCESPARSADLLRHSLADRGPKIS